MDSYLDALKEFPSLKAKLELQDGTAFPQKVDIFKGVMWYTTKSDPGKFVEVPVERVNEIIAQNKQGKKPAVLVQHEYAPVEAKPDYENVVGQDDLTRFDQPKRSKGKRSGGNRRKGGSNRNRNRNNRNKGNQGNKPKNG